MNQSLFQCQTFSASKQLIQHDEFKKGRRRKDDAPVEEKRRRWFPFLPYLDVAREGSKKDSSQLQRQCFLMMMVVAVVVVWFVSFILYT